MIIDCIGCLHGAQPELEGGDLLIITGDCTKNDSIPSWHEFFNWLDRQQYTRKIMIAGNHDTFCKQWATSDDSIHDILKGKPSVSYLCDSETECEGLKIWGSPWSAAFKGINPKCTAYTIPVIPNQEAELMIKWEWIPHDIDILITHTPAFGILDGIPMEDGSLFHTGSHSLYAWLRYVKRPKLHVFSHIHEAYGQEEHFVTLGGKMMKSVNCSIMNERYRPANKPVRIIL